MSLSNRNSNQTGSLPALRTLLVISLMTAILAAHATAQPKPPPAAVVVTRVVEREVTIGEEFIGTVMPMRRSVVGCAVDGRVFEFFADEGDLVRLESKEASEGDERRVDVGQPIAQLRVKTIGIEIAVARAELDIRDYELQQLEQSLPEELAQANARRLSTEALMKYTNAKFQRTESLFQRGGAAQEELDEALSASIAAQQVFAGAKSAYNQLEKTREIRIAGAKARLAAQQESLLRLEDIKSKYTIRAPFEGYVVTKFTEVGAWLSRGDPVVEVIELDPVEISVSVSEAHIARLQAGREAQIRSGQKLEVQVSIDSLPGHLFKGEVTKIVPQADTRTRSFPVKIRVANPRGKDGHLIKPGMLARASFAVGTKQKSLLVPKDALVLGGRSPNIFVVVTDEKTQVATARPVSVQIGAAFGSLIEVRGSLKADDRVVVVGNERLRPGQPVRIAKEVQPE